MKSMLTKIKIHRPDVLLQKRLVALAYSLIALTASLIAFIIYPQYLVLLLSVIGITTTVCLLLSLQIIKVAEKAISYGGFANEIIKQSYQAERIETYDGKIVIENDAARDLFGGNNILDFLQSRLADCRNNIFAMQQIKNGFDNLSPTKVVLALNFDENETGSSNSSWFRITMKIIFLRKTEIFNQPFSIKKVQKDIYIHWSFQDITAEHNIEQVFQTERQYMHDFLDYLPAILYITDKDYKIEYCNQILAEKLGKSREEITGTFLTDYLAANSTIPPHNTLWDGIVHFTNCKGKVFEVCLKQDSFREGNEIKIRAAGMSDLPNNQTLQQQLGCAVDEISWLFDFAPVGIIFADKQGYIQECNNRAAYLLNDKTSHLLGKCIIDVVRKENVHSLLREISMIVNGEKENSSLEIGLNAGDKMTTFYLAPMKRLFADKDANIEGFVLYVIDTTRQKSLELQFAQAQKMQALGLMAGGVAHDFNNLLTAIIGFCDLLIQRHSVGDPSFADLVQIKNNANRAAALVRGLLAYSRRQPLQPKYIDITENLEELSYMLKRILSERITLKFHHGDDLGFTKVDPGQLSQVIINLAVNAKDAMNGCGTLTITTRTEKLTEPRQFGEEIIKPGDFVVIDVADTGCGIAKENLNRIFDPFFSTKQNIVGSGTGLGLAMVLGIVRQTGGFIDVDSVVNQGTTFSIYLPRFETNPDTENKDDLRPQNLTANENSPIVNVKTQKNQGMMQMNQKFIFGLNVSAIDKGIDAKNPHAGIRILFVEDENSVRSFAMRALKNKGYDVVGCSSAENAMEQLQNDTNFDLLLTDMVMPGMNGAELAAKVRALIPNIKVILASGYSEEIADSESGITGEYEFLAKPFSLGDLTKKIFDVLNKG